tara:strand:+ start:1844 stop:2623 length:780 start_codon:yes stop_codon:yes gene_type:complete
MVLYFTTCNKILYKASCKLLIQSFIKYSNKNDLLYVFHENVENFITHSKITYINVDKCEIYTRWFDNFKHIIPEKYGGLAKPENDQRLQIGLAVKWNQKACLWFWKIVAYKSIIKYLSQDISHWVFLDSDTRFISSLDSDFFEKNCPCALNYHLGKFRKGIHIDRCAGIESGIVVFKNTSYTFAILKDLVDTFTSGDFLNYERWDDGYILRMIVQKPVNSLHCMDIVAKANEKNVIGVGPFAGKIVHDVGKHHRLKLDQ